jgi:hypothetical protein
MTWLPLLYAMRIVLVHPTEGEPIRKSLVRGFHNFKGLTW